MAEGGCRRPISRVLSVHRGAPDGHSSRRAVTHTLQQPTRGSMVGPEGLASLFETGRLSPPIWPCSDRGLPCHTRCRVRGGLLPHPFTLTAFSRRRRFAFCCTVRRMKLAPHAPRRYLAICPVEPGLSSEPERGDQRPSSDFATIRPTTSCPQYSGPVLPVTTRSPARMPRRCT